MGRADPTNEGLANFAMSVLSQQMQPQDNTEQQGSLMNLYADATAIGDQQLMDFYKNQMYQQAGIGEVSPISPIQNAALDQVLGQYPTSGEMTEGMDWETLQRNMRIGEQLQQNPGLAEQYLSGSVPFGERYGQATQRLGERTLVGDDRDARWNPFTYVGSAVPEFWGTLMSDEGARRGQTFGAENRY